LLPLQPAGEIRKPPHNRKSGSIRLMGAAAA
jgi:hypothetical protein